MRASEVAELLALAAAYDNRNVTKEAAVGWKVAIDAQIPDLETGMAREIIIDHFGTSAEYLTVRHVIEGAKQRLRRLPKQISDDVRSAKTRGLISRDWDSRTPLPREVAVKLEQARAEVRENAPTEIESGPSKLQLDVGRRI